jgi:ABC-type transporter Mla maintaining outer membrane lipid asymmetry ATPase subunit MlaF
LNEREFILSLQNGDQLAFKQLVDTWQHMVYNTVLSIVQDIQEAEDVAQEVFIQVYQSVKISGAMQNYLPGYTGWLLPRHLMRSGKKNRKNDGQPAVVDWFG